MLSSTQLSTAAMLPSRPSSIVGATHKTTTTPNSNTTTPRSDTSPYITTSAPASSRPTRLRPLSQRFPVTTSPPRPIANEYTTPFVRPSPSVSPETVREIFPTDLPPRPPPQRSFLTRIFSRSRTSHVSSSMPTQRSPSSQRNGDVEMGVLGPAEEGRMNVQKEQDRMRRFRRWGMVMVGIVLGVAIGLFVYSVVRHEEGVDGQDGEGGMEWDY